MHTIGTIRAFHTPQFTVVVDAVEDDCTIDDLHSEPETQKDIIDGLESGRYVQFCARARVIFAGADIAADYLGGCVYGSLSEFAEPHGYFADMVHEVCRQARAHLCKLQAVRVRC